MTAILVKVTRWAVRVKIEPRGVWVHLLSSPQMYLILHIGVSLGCSRCYLSSSEYKRLILDKPWMSYPEQKSEDTDFMPLASVIYLINVADLV